MKLEKKCIKKFLLKTKIIRLIIFVLILISFSGCFKSKKSTYNYFVYSCLSNPFCLEDTDIPCFTGCLASMEDSIVSSFPCLGQCVSDTILFCGGDTTSIWPDPHHGKKTKLLMLYKGDTTKLKTESVSGKKIYYYFAKGDTISIWPSPKSKMNLCYFYIPTGKGDTISSWPPPGKKKCGYMNLSGDTISIWPDPHHGKKCSEGDTISTWPEPRPCKRKSIGNASKEKDLAICQNAVQKLIDLSKNCSTELNISLNDLKKSGFYYISDKKIDDNKALTPQILDNKNNVIAKIDKSNAGSSSYLDLGGKYLITIKFFTIDERNIKPGDKLIIRIPVANKSDSRNADVRCLIK